MRVAFQPEYQSSSALLAWFTGGRGGDRTPIPLRRAVVPHCTGLWPAGLGWCDGWAGLAAASVAVLLEARTVVALLCGPLGNRRPRQRLARTDE